MSSSRLALAAIWALACSPISGRLDPRDGGGDGGSSLAGLASIEIAPASAALTITNGAAASQACTATGRFSDGHTPDITAQVSWSLADSAPKSAGAG